MSKYKIMMVDGEQASCDSCDATAPLVKFESHVKRHIAEARPERLCEFCFETELGTILRYEKQHTHETVSLARAMAQAFNQLRRNMGPCEIVIVPPREEE